LETFGDCNERKGKIDHIHIYLKKQDVCVYVLGVNERRIKKTNFQQKRKQDTAYHTLGEIFFLVQDSF